MKFKIEKLNKGWIEVEVQGPGDLDGEPVGKITRIGPGSTFQKNQLVVFAHDDATHLEASALVREMDVIALVSEVEDEPK